jgi:hypothetical protein
MPDTIIDRLPIIRATIEEQLENSLRRYSTELSTELGEHLDLFLADNHDELAAFAALSKQPDFVNQFGDGLERQFVALLNRPYADGSSIRTHLQDGFAGLQHLEMRLDRLANADDLTAHEQRLRQIIALTMRLTEQDA